MTRTLIKSDEAEWAGPDRFWASVQQFPPKKRRSSWWLVLAGAIILTIVLVAGL